MKLLLYILVLTMVLAGASCTEKQYTCQCSGGLTGGTSDVEVIARNRVSAKNICNAYGNPPGTPDGQVCTLKD